jgi:D-sedoheptulose 7-phosphate isomerase
MGFAQYIGEIKDILGRLPLDSLQRICDVLYEAYERDRTIFIFGNGGSVALASHMVCDLGKGTHCPPPGSLEMTGIRRLKAIALTDNVRMITAWANDSACKDILVEQIENFTQPGNVAFAICGGGNSPNVFKA